MIHEDKSTPAVQALDLSECDREPIHVPGAVQSHGCIIAIDENSLKITHASENCHAFLPWEARTLLGEDWSRFSRDLAVDLALTDIPSGPDAIYRDIPFPDGALQLRAHRFGGRVIFEWERKDQRNAGSTPGEVTLPELGETNEYRASQLIAEGFASATGYDRVMVYRFHDDWSGEVIAEVRKPTAIPYLGLRYPATDIPPQARDLFLLNGTRIIGDVDASTSVILASPGLEPLDCSCTHVRAVSPFHLEYLHNMGVSATLVCAIVVNDRLWGLIVGHHDSPRYCSSIEADRATALSKHLAMHIANRLDQAAQQLEARLTQDQARLDALFGGLPVHASLSHTVFGGSSLRSLFQGTASAVLTDEAMISAGPAPDESAIRRLIDLAREEGEWSPVAFDRFPKELEGAAGVDCAGAMLAPVSLKDGVAWLLCFRPEETQEVLWGGDPGVPAYRDATAKLHPRESFELWREVVSGRCRAWTTPTRQRMQQLVSALKDWQEITVAEMNHAIVQFKDIGQTTVDAHGDLMPAQHGVVLSLEDDTGELRLRAANQNACHLLGIDPLMIQGTTLAQVLEAAAVRLEDLRRGNDQVNVWTATHGLRIVNIERRRALSVSGPGVSTQLFEVHLHDVTMDQRLMTAMTAERDRSLIVQKSQDALLANLSHEMRTPLNAVIGLAEILETDSEITDEERRDFLREIQSAGLQLTQLIDGLLDLAANEGGHMALDSETETDLALIATEAIKWIRPIADKNSVRLSELETSRVPFELPIRCDARKIRQVWLNLLANAVKFTPANGNVTARFGLDPNGAPFFEVEDTGVGISPMEQPHVFDRFYRGRHEGLGPRKGTGLGLALCRALIHLHGGVIHLSSQVGRGTRVRCTLPTSRFIKPGMDS